MITRILGFVFLFELILTLDRFISVSIILSNTGRWFTIWHFLSCEPKGGCCTAHCFTILTSNWENCGWLLWLGNCRNFWFFNLPIGDFAKKKIKMRNKKKRRMQNKSVCCRSANPDSKCVHVYEVVKRPDITMSTLKDFEPVS